MTRALSSETPFARLVAKALGANYFTLVDIGCSGGIDASWRVFGDHLRAIGFDPNLDEVNRLTEQETNPGVTYIPRFVGLSAEDKGTERMSTGDFWARNPWGRLSVWRTQQIKASTKPAADTEEKTKLNLWPEVRLADPATPVIIPSFLHERGINDVDFVKIDVDGADFLILRSLVQMLGDAKVLGLKLEITFFGSEEAEIHTFHNVDRLMKQCGFELFLLSPQAHSMAALPAPYQYIVPGPTIWGRVVCGDAIYFRDAAAPDHVRWAESAGEYKLAKLAALFSLAGLPDCAAEILITFRPVIERVLNVEVGLDILTAQGSSRNEATGSHAEYIKQFETDSDYFYPSRTTESGQQDALSIANAQLTEQVALLRKELAALRSSKSWRLTAPLRSILRSLKRTSR